jgi:GT2 family glycosyltransferase
MQTKTSTQAAKHNGVPEDIMEQISANKRLAEFHARKGNTAKSEMYARRVDELSAGLQDPSESEEERMQREIEATWRMLGEGKYDEIIDLYGRREEAYYIDLVTAALFRSKRYEAAEAYLDQFPPEEGILLKRKSLEVLKSIEAPLDVEPRVHMIILCHNRAKELTLALSELAKTKYRNYAVYIADNGSEDGSWDVLQEAVKAFPEHVEVHMERLPTNIGRPAGHNWLMTNYEHEAAEYIAIGDDDLVSVPPNWLSDMVKTAKLFPKCGAVGGKALDQGLPAVIHGGIRRFEYFAEQHFKISNEGNQADTGCFDVVDMTDHVIACLQIYDKKALDEVGLFDIRFSPCQLVDIEHHLRMRLAGWNIVFNGLVAFEHLRGMGKKAAKDRALIGNSIGNAVKLLHKYDKDEVQAFIETSGVKYKKWLHGGSDRNI